jgi:hypothetical protein
MRTKSFFAVLLLLAGTLAARAEEKKAPWKVSGQLEEACSCDAACPCWFDSHPTKMTCGGGQVIFIDKGTYGDVPLDGLAFGQMGQSPEGKSMMESIGNWNFVTFYIDEKADPAQRKALEAIARATFPPAAPPERTMLRYVPISRKVEGSEHMVSLGNYGTFSGHLVSGGMGSGHPKIVLPPGADPIHKEYMQGHDKANLQRLGTEVGLVQLELHVHDVRRHERGLRQVRRRHDAGNAEGEGGEEVALTPITGSRWARLLGRAFFSRQETRPRLERRKRV